MIAKSADINLKIAWQKKFKNGCVKNYKKIKIKTKKMSVNFYVIDFILYFHF